MKKVIITILFAVSSLVLATTDPNTPAVPPKPGQTSVRKIDNQTLRLTTSQDVKRSTLIQRKKQLMARRKVINDQILVIEQLLAQFEKE